MISVLSVNGQVILPTTALMPSVMTVANLATLPRTVPTKFLHQEHHTTMTDLVWGTITNTARGTDHTPIMVPDLGDDTADCSHIPIHAMTKVAVLVGTTQTLLPATIAAHTTLQLMDAPVTPLP